MADNVGYTPGTGATVAADDISGVLYQRVKLSLGSDGSAVDAVGNQTDGLLVDVSNISLPIGDGTNVVTIDVNPGDGEPNSGNALHVEGRNFVYNGTTWDRVRGDVTNGMDVDVTRVGGNVTVVGAGADGAVTTGNPVLIAGTDGTNTQTLLVGSDGGLNVDAIGNVGHDVIDTGSPVKIGTRARNAAVAAVASDDRADAISTLQGYVVTYPYALPQSALDGTATSTGTGDTAIIAAQGAGVTINVTTIAVYNDSTTNTFVRIKDGATTVLVLPAPARGGAMVTLPCPMRLTANSALNFASNAAVTTMYVSAVGFAGI